jgi:hypothetical protein
MTPMQDLELNYLLTKLVCAHSKNDAEIDEAMFKIVKLVNRFILEGENSAWNAALADGLATPIGIIFILMKSAASWRGGYW